MHSHSCDILQRTISNLYINIDGEFRKLYNLVRGKIAVTCNTETEIQSFFGPGGLLENMLRKQDEQSILYKVFDYENFSYNGWFTKCDVNILRLQTKPLYLIGIIIAHKSVFDYFKMNDFVRTAKLLKDSVLYKVAVTSTAFLFSITGVNFNETKFTQEFQSHNTIDNIITSCIVVRILETIL